VQEDLGLFDDRVVLSASWRNDYEHSWGLNHLTQTSGYLGGWKDNKGVPRFSVTVKTDQELVDLRAILRAFRPLQSTNKYFIVLGTPSPEIYAKYNNFSEIEYFNPTESWLKAASKARTSMASSRLVPVFSTKSIPVRFSAALRRRTTILPAAGRPNRHQPDQRRQCPRVRVGNLWTAHEAPELYRQLRADKGHYPNFADGMPHYWGSGTRPLRPWQI